MEGRRRNMDPLDEALVAAARELHDAVDGSRAWVEAEIQLTAQLNRPLNFLKAVRCEEKVYACDDAGRLFTYKLVG